MESIVTNLQITEECYFTNLPALEESYVDNRRVKVDKLEEEHLEGEGIFPLRLSSVRL